MSRSIFAALVLAVGVAAAPGFAQEFKVGDIVVDAPWARATPKGAEVGAGYLTIRNDGATPDKLLGGSADFAGVEVHEMGKQGGMMTMRQVSGGLEIPAHGSVKFAPSGYHLMFTHLKHPLAKGESVTATLTFEHAGALVVEFPVNGIGASGPGTDSQGGAMKGMKM